jgi:hypothetical protein
MARCEAQLRFKLTIDGRAFAFARLPCGVLSHQHDCVIARLQSAAVRDSHRFWTARLIQMNVIGDRLLRVSRASCIHPLHVCRDRRQKSAVRDRVVLGRGRLTRKD